jgi:outer membrane lipoprotein carrier protein
MLKKLLLTSALSLAANIASASPSDDFSSLLNGMKTMKSNFTQTVYDGSGHAIQSSNGQMALDRPGKFRWEVKKPIPQLIIANDKKLWIYDPDLAQVTIKLLNQSAGDTPALLLSHVGAVLSDNYVVTTVTEKPATLSWFMLKPKNNDNMFQAVEMGFNGNKISEMRLKDHLGHTTAIKFVNATTNTNLPAMLFSFKVPKGVDVIDETKRR